MIISYGQDKGKTELQNPYQMGPSFTDTKKLDALREMQRLKQCWTIPNWHAGHLKHKRKHGCQLKRRSNQRSDCPL